VLTPAGKKRGVAEVVRELNAWHQKNLSKYKWLRGGIQVVDEVCFLPQSFSFFFFFAPPFLHITHSFSNSIFKTDIILDNV
jgi:hypothetical protein